jgi:hypothetical protein
MTGRGTAFTGRLRQQRDMSGGCHGNSQHEVEHSLRGVRVNQLPYGGMSGRCALGNVLQQATGSLGAHQNTHGTQQDDLISLRKQTPWPLVHKRTIPTELPPIIGEI